MTMCSGGQGWQGAWDGVGARRPGLTGAVLVGEGGGVLRGVVGLVRALLVRGRRRRQVQAVRRGRLRSDWHRRRRDCRGSLLLPLRQAGRDVVQRRHLTVHQTAPHLPAHLAPCPSQRSAEIPYSTRLSVDDLLAACVEFCSWNF